MTVSPSVTARRFLETVRQRLIRALPRRLRSRLHRLRNKFRPALGSVRFGDLGSVRPISFYFGFDRGTPIDRYYIEKFLSTQATHIRGRVLEVGDDSYSRRFGKLQIERQ